MLGNDDIIRNIVRGYKAIFWYRREEYMYKNEFEIDVFRCLMALINKKGYIALITALFFIIGVGLSLDVGDDKYTSTATVYAASEKNYNEAANAVTAMNAYLNVATSYKVCQRAALILGRSDIDANDIKNSLMVTSSVKTSSSSTTIMNFMNSSATVLSFAAVSSDPELSREMADAVAEAYVIEMANILKYDSVQKLDSASTGTMSYNARTQAFIYRIEFMIAGFALACIFIVACEIFGKKVRTIREATIRNQIPIIGIIPDYKE